MTRSPSEYALRVCSARFEEILAALGRLSPSLAAEVRSSASGEGELSGRLAKAADRLDALSGSIFDDPDETAAKARRELSAALGSDFSQANVSVLLKAHAGGLRELSTVQGLGKAMFALFSSRYLAMLTDFIEKRGASGEDGDNAVSLLRLWAKTLITREPKDPSEDIMSELAGKSGEAEAAAYVVSCLAHAPGLAKGTKAGILLSDFFGSLKKR